MIVNSISFYVISNWKERIRMLPCVPLGWKVLSVSCMSVKVKNLWWVINHDHACIVNTISSILKLENINLYGPFDYCCLHLAWIQGLMWTLIIMMQRSVRTEDYSDSVAHVYICMSWVMTSCPTNHNLSCIIILLTISGQ